MSLLSWERGLKYELHFISKCTILSLLSWERGLKFASQTPYWPADTSLLSWERGLKFSGSLNIQSLNGRSSRGSVD